MADTPEQPFDPRDIPYGTYLLGLVIVGAIAAFTFIAPLRHSVFATFGINVLPSFVCGTSQVQDADGNYYDTVLIGTQCWMAQNLNVGTRVGISTTQTDNATIEKWCYDDTDANCDSNIQAGHNNPDGGLYQWEEAMQYSATEGAQGICPTGWHIPTDAEWHTLESYLATGSCSASRTGWDCDPAGTLLKPNGSSGFEGNLAGNSFSGLFNLRGTAGNFWSSSESGTAAWYRLLNSAEARVYRIANVQSLGLSVRCLKNDPTPTNPTVTIATTPTIPELDQGLVGHWTFDGQDIRWQDTTSEIKDVSGNGNHGDATGTISGTSSPNIGVLGQALSLNGGSDRIEVGDKELANSAISLAAWVYPTSVEASGVARKWGGSNGNRAYMFSLTSLLEPRLEISDDGLLGDGSTLTVTTNDRLPVNRWSHVVATFDGIGNGSVFIDGVESASSSDLGVIGIFDSPDSLLLATGYAQTGIPGSLDDVRIYNRALSADEVMRLYKLGEGTKISTTIKNTNSPLENGLVGHWTFDGPDIRWQDSSSEIKDVSGYGNHGDAQGGMNVESPTFGKLGQAMEFDAVDTVVSIANSAEIDTLEKVTVSAWLKPLSYGETVVGRIVGKSENTRNSPDGWQMIVCGGGTLNCASGPTLYLTFNYDGDTGRWHALRNTFPLGSWKHLVISYDGSSVDNDPVVYLDGESVTVTRDNAPVGNRISDSIYNLCIGGTCNGGDTFDGTLDDVRIYNRVLSAEEAQMLYQLGR